jgi:hypothetical protein
MKPIDVDLNLQFLVGFNEKGVFIDIGHGEPFELHEDHAQEVAETLANPDSNPVLYLDPLKISLSKEKAAEIAQALFGAVAEYRKR